LSPEGSIGFSTPPPSGRSDASSAGADSLSLPAQHGLPQKMTPFTTWAAPGTRNLTLLQHLLASNASEESNTRNRRGKRDSGKGDCWNGFVHGVVPHKAKANPMCHGTCPMIDRMLAGTVDVHHHHAKAKRNQPRREAEMGCVWRSTTTADEGRRGACQNKTQVRNGGQCRPDEGKMPKERGVPRDAANSAVGAAATSPPQDPSSHSLTSPSHPDESHTLSSSLQLLSAEDPDTLLIVRRIGKLGFKASRILKEHFTAQGAAVVRVLVATSTVREGDGKQGRIVMRRRPGSLGFVQMHSALGVQCVLAHGEEQYVEGASILVQKFERQSAHNGA